MRKIKKVDIYAYMPILVDIVNSGKESSLLISGNSMAPFLIHERDTIIVSKPTSPFKKGDMVFYQRKNGQYIMHRIHHIKDGKLYIVGDAQVEIEGPIETTQVFGIIHKVIRKGKLIDKNDFWWFFFEKIWIQMVPLRRILVKLYQCIR